MLMKNRTFVILFSLLTVLSGTRGFAQNWDEIKKQYHEQFNTFHGEIEQKFNAFVDKNDQDFADFLRDAWVQYELVTAIKVPDSPKPKDVPKVDPIVVDENKPDNIVVEVPAKDTTQNVKPNIPPIQKVEDDDFETTALNFMFYGLKASFKYDKNFITKYNGTINEAYFADFWVKMSDTKHYSFVNQLQNFKTEYNLNDWAYFTLISQATNQIADKNTAKLLTWFLMVKSQFKVRVAYNGNDVYLLLPSNQVIYNRPYYVFDGTNYYLAEESVSSVYTYKKDYPDARFALNMSVESPIALGTRTKVRNLKFEYNQQTYNIPVTYNLDVIDFYSNYPQTEIRAYFDAVASPEVKESLMNSLTPLVQGKNELDAANLVLHFVQTVFDYQTDQEQFNKEKFFFPDELFHYPYSDCEDRSVLFAYLAKELLNLKVVGLAYPGHMATAVGFRNDYGYDYLTFNGEKFIITDPTYINAPVGMCMPAYVGVKAKVIELKNKQNVDERKRKIWDKVIAAGAIRASNGNDVVVANNGNVYIAGYFRGTIKIDDQELVSANQSNDILIACFDKNEKLVWARRFGEMGSEAAVAIALDITNQIYVAGYYDQAFLLGKRSLESNGVRDVFMAKLDESGTVRWANRMMIEAPAIEDEYTYTARFDAEGNHVSTVVFEQSEYFSNYGISIDRSYNSIVTVSYVANKQNETFAAAGAFSFTDDWKTMSDKMIGEKYSTPIAGLFAFLKTMNVSGAYVTGKTTQSALDAHNPNFKKLAPRVYQNLSKIESISNSAGIITIRTVGKADIVFDEVAIKDNAKVKVTTYQGGNAQINVLSGVNFGKSAVNYNINSVKLIKESGDLLFDFDDDHTQKRVNMKAELLH